MKLLINTMGPEQNAVDHICKSIFLNEIFLCFDLKLSDIRPQGPNGWYIISGSGDDFVAMRSLIMLWTNNKSNLWRCIASLGVSVLSTATDNKSQFVHDDVIKCKHFPRYWPFVRGIHRSPVNSPHKGQWRGALIFSLICIWING